MIACRVGHLLLRNSNLVAASDVLVSSLAQFANRVGKALLNWRPRQESDLRPAV